MSLSTPEQRRKLCPNIIEEIGYQNDVDMKKFQQMCRNDGERFAAQYPGLLNSEEYINYIKNPFNKKRTLDFLNTQTPRQTKTGRRGDG
jgi:hypothetical protein